MSKIIKIENAQEVFQKKIEKCINKVGGNENENKIDYLTVCLVGKSCVGKSTLLMKYWD